MLVCVAFLLSYSSTILKRTETTSWSQSTGCPRVSQSISVFRKKVPRVFFFSLFLEDLKPSSKVLCCSYHSAIQRSNVFFLTSNNIYRVWTGQPPALAETTEEKGIFLNFQDWHPLCGLWHHQITTKIIWTKTNYLLSRSTSVFFFFFSICHCNLGSCAT